MAKGTEVLLRVSELIVDKADAVDGRLEKPEEEGMFSVYEAVRVGELLAGCIKLINEAAHVLIVIVSNVGYTVFLLPPAFVFPRVKIANEVDDLLPFTLLVPKSDSRSILLVTPR